MTAPTSSTLLRSLADSAATHVVAATGDAPWVTAGLPHASSLCALSLVTPSLVTVSLVTVSLVTASLVTVSLVTVSLAALSPERLRRGYRFSGTAA
jgi:hypothetical protein